MSGYKCVTNWSTLEHSRAAYRADFLLYGIAVGMLSVFLLVAAPPHDGQKIAALVLAGLAGWSLVEYALHRFVLHGMRPFKRWHMEHHRRPTALICTPTLLSAALIALLVFLPSLFSSNLWSACALTLGLLIGYMGYAIAHHAIHHWHSKNSWLKHLKRLHAMHHHTDKPGNYGVTSTFWDHAFGTAHEHSRRINQAMIHTPSRAQKSDRLFVYAASIKARDVPRGKSELK